MFLCEWEYFNVYIFSDFPGVSITLPAYLIKMPDNRKSRKEEKVNRVEVKGENNVTKKRKTQGKKSIPTSLTFSSFPHFISTATPVGCYVFTSLIRVQVIL